MMDPALLVCRVQLAVAKTQGLRVLTASPSLAAWAALMPRQAPLLPAYMSPALETSAVVPSRTSRRIPSAMALAAAVPLMAHTGPLHMEVRAWHPYKLAIIHQGTCMPHKSSPAGNHAKTSAGSISHINDVAQPAQYFCILGSFFIFTARTGISVPYSTCYVIPFLHKALHQQMLLMQSLSMALCSDGEALSSAEVWSLLYSKLLGQSAESTSRHFLSCRVWPWL